MSSLPIGQTFGRLSFLGVSDQRGPGGRQMWRMACACGSAVVLAANKVKTGNTKSCGCLRSAPDLSGLRFGVLAVLGDAARGADGRHRVRCRCDCGAEVVVAPSDLRKSRGATVSCGCFRATFGRSNAADLSGRVFGRLTAGAPASSDRRGVVWSCPCACGAATTALASDLIGGRKVSCGCAVVDKPGLTPAGLNARRVAGGHRRRALSAARRAWERVFHRYRWLDGRPVLRLLVLPTRRRNPATGVWASVVPRGGRRLTGQQFPQLSCKIFAV